MPLLIYLTDVESNYVLRELHERICGIHVTGTSLALKALRMDILVDTLDLVKRCDKCQRHAHVLRKPSPK